MAAPSIYTDEQAAAALRQDPGTVQASSDPTEATAQTVEYMCRLINDSLADGVVQRATLEAMSYRPWRAWASIWWWVKLQLKFVHHQSLLIKWLGAPDELQLLIRPDALLKMQEPKGDCAVYTTLICAMLDCCGLPWEIVTVAVDPRSPGIYSHVYPRVILTNGQRIPLDASHGKYPGWEVPVEHVSARQVWDQDGEPIEDVAPMKFNGLHGVDMSRYGLGEFRGLGQDPTDVTELPTDYASTSDQILLTPASATPVNTDAAGGVYCAGYGQGYDPTTGLCVGSGSSSSSASITPQQTNALSSLATQLTSIFGQVVAPTTQMVRNADGSYSYVTPGSGAVPATSSSTLSSSTLLMIGLAIGGLLILPKLFK